MQTTTRRPSALAPVRSRVTYSHVLHTPPDQKVSKNISEVCRSRWLVKQQRCAPDHLTQGSREFVRQIAKPLVVHPSVLPPSTGSHADSPRTTIPHEARKAFSLVTSRTFVPKSALFAFEDTDLICSPRSRTISCSQSVFTTKAFTFLNPARCAIPRSATGVAK